MGGGIFMIRAVLLIVMLSVIVSTGVAAGAAGSAFKGDPLVVAEVKAVYKKMASMHTWRARTRHFRAGGLVDTTMVEFVAPDRFHITMTRSGRTTEIFKVGKDLWTMSGGACRKAPGSIPTPDPRDWQGPGTDVTITVTRGDRATVDGTPTQTYLLDYEVTYKAASGTSKEKLYVATGTGLPRRAERTSSAGSPSTSGASTSTTDYYDYNAPITINSPPC